MGIQKLTSCDGYLSLIQQTAAHDAEKRGRATLGDHDAGMGESPVRWVGRGLAALGEPTSRVLLTDLEKSLWRVEAGSTVTEDQMKNLFWLGLHPNAGKIAEYLISQGVGTAAAEAAIRLGRPYVIKDGPTTSTAGYDLTFSPVKSFSALWALAPIELSKILEQCQDRAVADTLESLQDNAAFARMGAQGVAQIDTDGFIAVQFTGRESNAGDPNLHTRIAVSNKVRAHGPDGFSRWLALDGRPLFKGAVAASEFYNTRLEAYAIELAGLVFEERPATERGKRPVREIAGMPTELCDVFSSRRLMITDRYTGLAEQFQADHGREPTTREGIALYQRATWETRPAKHEPRSPAEQCQQWQTRAIEHLGTHEALNEMLVNVWAPKHRDVPDVTDELVAEQARIVLDTVAKKRSSWQKTHIYAEAQRRVRAAGLATDRALADVITAAALSLSR